MKKRLAIILSGAAAAGVLSLGLSSSFAQTTNQVPPTGIPPAPGTPGIPNSPAAPQPIPGRPAPPQPGARPPGFPRRMPSHMPLRNALRALDAAKRDLNAATTDFDGHRQAALDACDKAIAELNEALKHAPEPTPPPTATPPGAAPGTPPPAAPVAPPAPK